MAISSTGSVVDLDLEAGECGVDALTSLLFDAAERTRNAAAARDVGDDALGGKVVVTECVLAHDEDSTRDEHADADDGDRHEDTVSGALTELARTARRRRRLESNCVHDVNRLMTSIHNRARNFFRSHNDDLLNGSNFDRNKADIYLFIH